MRAISHQYFNMKPRGTCDQTVYGPPQNTHCTEPASESDEQATDLQVQKSQSSSSVLIALPITYEEPEPEKKSWFYTATWSEGRKCT